jgi:hypothetical protein
MDTKPEPAFQAIETAQADESLARLRAHRNNVHRYRRLLGTRISDLERDFLHKRLLEEQSAFDALSARTFPLGLTGP